MELPEGLCRGFLEGDLVDGLLRLVVVEERRGQDGRLRQLLVLQLKLRLRPLQMGI